MPQSLPEISQDISHHTPMMQQYLTLKADYPHALLLYRMGDFYELFFDDAKRAADILGITLTRRGVDKQGNVIPMAGVPFHSADGYIARLINAGQTIVVCEQVEEDKSENETENNVETFPLKNPEPSAKITPKTASKASSKPTIMQRKVVRTLTAGTLTDDNLITQGQTPTVVAISFAKNAMSVGLAQLDLTQGQIQVTQLDCDSLANLQSELTTALSRFAPSEILIDEQLSEAWQHCLQHCISTLGDRPIPIMAQAHSYFLPNNAFEHLTQHLQVSTLSGFGLDTQTLAVTAASVVLYYGKQTQQTSLDHIRQIKIENNADFLQLDSISQQNLEIFKPVLVSGISLLSVIDHCKTPMGKRTLVHHLHRPLLNVSMINRRLDAVEQLMNLAGEPFNLLNQTLSEIGDIERIGGRIGLGSAKPTDLLKLRQSIEQSTLLAKQIHSNFDLNRITTLDSNTPLLAMLAKQLPSVNADNLENDSKKGDCFADIIALLNHAIVDEPPAHIRDGGMIKTGYDPELDQLQRLHSNIEQNLETLANKERQAHNLPMLKVGFNKVSGFYFELSSLQAKNAPAHFERRQTLKNAERYITPELKTLEESYLSAQGQAVSLEKRLYENLVNQLKSQLNALQRLAKAVGYLDVLANWVRLAQTSSNTAQEPWCRPVFLENDRLDNDNLEDNRLENGQAKNPVRGNSASLNIEGGRHIVVEMGQKRQQATNATTIPREPFVANDCQIGTMDQPERLMLITGPNMGGKSTYMRQTALIVLLACCGAFVPARSVQLGRIARIFTRIGSADDLASGKSTFMVEMLETANIMNQANANSLVLMDEVGRGTSTQDGLAIAHACVNYLADNIGGLTLFATHYFELTELAEQHPKMFNQHLVTQEIDGQLLLLHKIAKGATHRSFGLHVAKMAGVPQALLTQAKAYLDQQLQKQADEYLEKSASLATKNTTENVKANLATLPLNPAIDKLNHIQPDNLTPKQALELIYALKELLNVG